MTIINARTENHQFGDLSQWRVNSLPSFLVLCASDQVHGLGSAYIKETNSLADSEHLRPLIKALKTFVKGANERNEFFER